MIHRRRDRRGRIARQRLAVERCDPLGGPVEQRGEGLLLREPADRRDLQVRLTKIIARFKTEPDEAVGEIGFEQFPAPQAAPHALACDRQQKNTERCVKQDRARLRPQHQRPARERIEDVRRFDDHRLARREAAPEHRERAVHHPAMLARRRAATAPADHVVEQYRFGQAGCDARLIERVGQHCRGAIGRMKDEMERGRCRPHRAEAVAPAQYRRRRLFAQMRVGEEGDRAALVARDPAKMEGVVPRIVSMREPFGVVDNGGHGGRCGHQSTLPIGPADGKHGHDQHTSTRLRSRGQPAWHRGLAGRRQ